MTASPNDTKQIIAEELAQAVELRHELHAHPQLGYEETFAVEVITRELREAGIEHQTGIGVTGVVGWILPDDAEKRSLPAIALRADMDALPIDEQTGLAYQSQFPGFMHACGHDGHVAMLLAAAKTLQKLKHSLPRPVKFFFQPAEEGDGGAEKMIADGAMTSRVGGCEVGATFALHGMPTLQLGQLAVRPGPCMAGVNGFKIIVEGKGTHGATPHLGRNPITAGAEIVSALQNVADEIKSELPKVVSICAFNSGSASNIIPDTAEIMGTIRTYSADTAEKIIARIRNIASQVATKLGCAAKMKSLYGYPVTANSPEAAGFVRSVSEKILGEGNVTEAPLQTIAEDFSYFAQLVPSCLAFLGLRPADWENYPPLHNPKFDFNDQAIPIGAAILARLAMESTAENLKINS